MSGEACGVELRVIGNVAMNAKRYGARARVYVHETKRATPRRAGTRASQCRFSSIEMIRLRQS